MLEIIEKTIGKNNHDGEDFNKISSMCGILYSDYVTMRFLYKTEPLICKYGIIRLSIEILERSFKLLLLSHKESVLKNGKNSHNVNYFRERSIKFNDTFSDDDVVKITKYLSDNGGKISQYLKYGYHDDIEEFYAHLDTVVPVVDKVFFTTLFSLSKIHKMTLLMNSNFHKILMNNNFNQSKNPYLMVNVLIEGNNDYIKEFIRYCSAYNDDLLKLKLELPEDQKKFLEERKKQYNILYNSL